MIVLDTNVLSELMRPAGAVLRWIEQQADEDLFISAITMAEILHGIARLPEGKRKQHLTVQALEMFEEDFADHILPFDADAADICAISDRQRAVRQACSPGRCADRSYLPLAAGRPCHKKHQGFRRDRG